MGNDFDWKDADMVVAEQLEIAVYQNPQHSVVIRQRHDDDGDDQIVVVRPENVLRIIKALQKIRPLALKGEF